MTLCMHCHTELPGGARFCMNCGHPVQVISPESEARHARLAATAPPPLAEKARAANRLSGERRLVTAMYVDVVHSRLLAQQLSPEAYEDVIVGIFERACPIIYRYEGTIATLQEDELLAFFGAPIAHEDDPLRAVHTALDLLEEAKTYAQEMRHKYQVDFAIRISLSSGPVTLGPVGSDLRYEYSALGGDLNLAAQIEAAKLAMNVHITEATYRFVAPYFECRDLGEVHTASMARPVRVYQVEGRKTIPGMARGLAGLQSPLVGRQKEMDTLMQLGQALQAGLGRAALILGEPGIGKSRLIAEWKAALDHRPSGQAVRWAEGRCLSYGQSLGYHLVISLLRSLLGLTSTASETETSVALYSLVEEVCTPNELALDSAAPDGAEVMEIFPYLGHLLSLNLSGEAYERLRYLDPQARLARGQVALRLLLRGLAARYPLGIVLEDLHWSDSASIEFLTQVIPLAASERILFILIMRPEREAPGWRLATTAREILGNGLTEISLSALSQEESRQLIANLLQIDALPENVRLIILQKAEGNPFFVEEVIRMLIDRDLILLENGRWTARPGIHQVDIPDNLQSLLLARIDRLPEQVKNTLRIAAVIGRQFPVKVLEEVLARENLAGHEPNLIFQGI